MDLVKANKVSSLLTNLSLVELESNRISSCKESVLISSDTNGPVTVNGYNINVSKDLVIKFLEDIEREMHSKKVKILEEITKL